MAWTTQGHTRFNVLPGTLVGPSLGMLCFARQYSARTLGQMYKSVFFQRRRKKEGIRLRGHTCRKSCLLGCSRPFLSIKASLGVFFFATLPAFEIFGFETRPKGVGCVLLLVYPLIACFRYSDLQQLPYRSQQATYTLV